MLLHVHAREPADEIGGIVHAFAPVGIHGLIPAGGDVEEEQGSKQTSEVKVNAAERFQNGFRFDEFFSCGPVIATGPGLLFAARTPGYCGTRGMNTFWPSFKLVAL